jgi:hypothetical protein
MERLSIEEHTHHQQPHVHVLESEKLEATVEIIQAEEADIESPEVVTSTTQHLEEEKVG